MDGATIRATVSRMPAGGTGTISVTGLVGNGAWAQAVAVSAEKQRVARRSSFDMDGLSGCFFIGRSGDRCLLKYLNVSLIYQITYLICKKC